VEVGEAEEGAETAVGLVPAAVAVVMRLVAVVPVVVTSDNERVWIKITQLVS